MDQQWKTSDTPEVIPNVREGAWKPVASYLLTPKDFVGLANSRRETRGSPVRPKLNEIATESFGRP